jgi:hypothetical protein
VSLRDLGHREGPIGHRLDPPVGQGRQQVLGAALNARGPFLQRAGPQRHPDQAVRGSPGLRRGGGDRRFS